MNRNNANLMMRTTASNAPLATKAMRATTLPQPSHAILRVPRRGGAQPHAAATGPQPEMARGPVPFALTQPQPPDDPQLRLLPAPAVFINPTTIAPPAPVSDLMTSSTICLLDIDAYSTDAVENWRCAEPQRRDVLSGWRSLGCGKSAEEHPMSEPVGGPLSRRRFVRGSAAAASAVVAVTYVSPTLRSIRMPTAYAAVSAPDEAAVLTVGTGRASNDVEGINRGEIPHELPNTGSGGLCP